MGNEERFQEVLTYVNKNMDKDYFTKVEGSYKEEGEKLKMEFNFHQPDGECLVGKTEVDKETSLDSELVALALCRSVEGDILFGRSEERGFR